MTAIVEYIDAMIDAAKAWARLEMARAQDELWFGAGAPEVEEAHRRRVQEAFPELDLDGEE